MIIKLTDADFSAKNLGQVSVKSSVSTFTKAAIAASGNTELSLDKQFSLDDFFVKIGAVDNSGIFTKIRHLYIPMLALSVEKALVDYANGNEFVGISSDGWGIRDNGLGAVTDMAVSSIMVNSDKTYDTSNLSIVVAVSDFPVYGNDLNILCLSTGKKDSRLSLKIASGSDNATYRPAFMYASGTETFAGHQIGETNKWRSTVASLGDNVKFLFPSGDTTTKEWTDGGPVENSATGLRLLCNLAGTGTWTNTMGSLRFLAIGEELSADEMESIKTSVDELIETIIS